MFSLFCRFSFTIQFSLCFFFLPESLTTAGVAFHLILVATTAQLVLELGFSGGICCGECCSPLAERRADSPTSWCVTWTFAQTCTTRVVLKLCCLTVSSWLWTQWQFPSCQYGTQRRSGFGSSSPEGAHSSAADRQRRTGQVVLGVEVGGRWSSKTRSFLSKLAHDRARSERFLMRKRVEQVWRLRWGSLLSCAAARAVAMSLLDLPSSRESDGTCPATRCGTGFQTRLSGCWVSDPQSADCRLGCVDFDVLHLFRGEKRKKKRPSRFRRRYTSAT